MWRESWRRPAPMPIRMRSKPHDRVSRRWPRSQDSVESRASTRRAGARDQDATLTRAARPALGLARRRTRAAATPLGIVGEVEWASSTSPGPWISAARSPTSNCGRAPRSIRTWCSASSTRRRSPHSSTTERRPGLRVNSLGRPTYTMKWAGQDAARPGRGQRLPSERPAARRAKRPAHALSTSSRCATRWRSRTARASAPDLAVNIMVGRYRSCDGLGHRLMGCADEPTRLRGRLPQAEALHDDGLELTRVGQCPAPALHVAGQAAGKNLGSTAAVTSTRWDHPVQWRPRRRFLVRTPRNCCRGTAGSGRRCSTPGRAAHSARVARDHRARDRAGADRRYPTSRAWPTTSANVRRGARPA